MLTVETSRWAEFFGGRLTSTVFPKQIMVTEGRDKDREGALFGGSLGAGRGGDAVWEDCLGSTSQGHHLGYAGI
jgi:hypothetical protein